MRSTDTVRYEALLQVGGRCLFVSGAYVAKPNVKTFSGGEFGWGGTSVKG